jgi:hypothetical protein
MKIYVVSSGDSSEDYSQHRVCRSEERAEKFRAIYAEASYENVQIEAWEVEEDDEPITEFVIYRAYYRTPKGSKSVDAGVIDNSWLKTVGDRILAPSLQRHSDGSFIGYAEGRTAAEAEAAMRAEIERYKAEQAQA